MASAAALTADLEYRLLLEISQKISGTLDLQTVLTHLLDSIRSVIDYDAAGIFVVSRSVPLARDAGPFRIVGMVQVGFEKPRSDDPMLRFGKGATVRKECGGRELLERGGPALGIIEDCRFECATVTLDPGDLMAFYTDGVVELSDAEDVEFGLDRLEGVLRDFIRLPAAEMIRSVVDVTRVFAGRDGYDDDFTLVLIKRESPG